MRRTKAKVVSGLILLLLVTGLSWASEYDFNPGQEGVKHKHDMTSDVQGEGYSMEYLNINTNNLSMLEYAHGSGTMDYADTLYDEQKSIYSADNYYYIISATTFEWTKKLVYGQSMIKYTRQYDNTQSPTSFAYGTGWYATHPVIYDSLLKDKNEAHSYQESASMHRQIEYARAVKGDISVEINCTGPTQTNDGRGLLTMDADEDIVQGTLHFGELLTVPMSKVNTPKYENKQGWKDAIIETDSNYIGNFKVQKTMALDFKKSKSSWGEDWLPCCSGGFFDIPSWNLDKERSGQKGIFDCTCRNTSISTMKPKWNTSEAQFPTAKYQYVP